MVFILAAAVLWYGLPFTDYKGMYADFRKKAFSYLNLVADSKREKLNLWLRERRADAEVLAKDPYIIRETEKQLASPPEKITQESATDLNVFLTQIKNTYRDYHRIEILAAGSGKQLSSSTPGSGPQSPAWPLPAPEDLSVGALDAIVLMPSGADGDLFLLINKTLSLTPDRETPGQIRAILRLAIHTRDILRPLMMLGGDLGETGEVVLFNSDRRIITPLKFPPANSKNAELFTYQIDSPMARLAAQGGEGAAQSVDYRGVAVLGAFRHIAINNATHWRLIAKQDEAEIFAPLRRTFFSYGVIGALCLFIAAIFSLIMARSLSRPIEHISNALLNVQQGSLEAQLPRENSAETAILAEGFNAMLSEIRERRGALEAQVAQRTAQLACINNELTQEINRRIKSEKDKELLLREIHHRVKNNMQVIISLMNLQSDYSDNEFVRNMFRNTRNRVSAMALAHELLYRKPELDEIDGYEYLTGLVKNLSSTIAALDPSIRIYTRVHSDVVFLKPDILIPCGLIVNELVTNSLKYAFPPGFLPPGATPEITVELRRESPGRYTLSVRDNGCGLPPELDPENTHTLGLQLVTALASQLEGALRISRSGGATFSITFNDAAKHFHMEEEHTV